MHANIKNVDVLEGEALIMLLLASLSVNCDLPV